MLDYDQRPSHIAPSIPIPALDDAMTKTYIMREIKYRMKERLIEIVDTAVAARMRRLEASQRANKSCIDKLPAAERRDGQTFRELDALRRHEKTLNTALQLLVRRV